MNKIRLGVIGTGLAWEPDGIDMEKEGLKTPSSTWTYLVDDSPEQLGIIPMGMVVDSFGAAMSMLTLAVNRWLWHRKQKRDKYERNEKII